ncbi:hypothetical protein E4634_16535 [Mangrovimicrobium sediminis]|uniref:Sulfotransferase domain-containing protein n=1 Tax=Mangrovimicrobium sediminis TaxID=2562682 RepID=A0A4Z0LX44_9GAMM|nr:hypothetical protein [Haliea sp. SAOS-164]TGD71726.1 hypothetical protein E4634_16535 [Haliea sp. SAOS-164]
MSGKKLIVHPGTHKTGTSSIQDYLFHTRDEAEHTYLNSGIPNSSMWINQAFEPGKSPQVRDHARNKLQEAIEKSNTDIDIISAESISKLNRENTLELYNFFKPYYSKIVVHIFFRPMKSRMESAFQERQKQSFRPLNEKYNFSYAIRLNILDDVFESQNVFAHKYDKSLFPNGDVVRYFMDKAELPWRDADVPSSNFSLSKEAIQLLYIYRKFHRDFKPEDKTLLSELRQLKGEKLHFHSELYRELLISGEHAVQRFEDRAGFSIEEDITAYDTNALRNEEDILRVSPSTIDWLMEKLALSQSEHNIQCDDLQSIADAVGRLKGEPSPTQLGSFFKKIVGKLKI